MFFIETIGRLVGSIQGEIHASKEINRQRKMQDMQMRFERDKLASQDMKIAYDTANRMSQDPELQQFCWGPGAHRNPAAQLRIAQEYEKAGALMQALLQYEKAAKLGSGEAKPWIKENKDRISKAYLMS